MSEFAAHQLLEFTRHKDLREDFRGVALKDGIEIDGDKSHPTEAFVAIYAYGLDYDHQRLMYQLIKCQKYAREFLPDAQLAYFVDGRPLAPVLKKLHGFVKEGAVKAVICCDIETFRFADTYSIKKHLAPFSAGGVDFHFAEESFETKLLRPNGVGRPMAEPHKASASAFL